MTDKELIKQEIERLYNLYELANDYQRMGACSTILDFIDSLPEEPKCIYNRTLDERKKFCKYCSAACNVRIEEEHTSEDLEEEITKCYKSRIDLMMTRKQFGEIIHRFTEWQKHKDKETIELAEDHAMLAGMNKMKEEMMENAVYGYVSLCHDYPHRRSLVAVEDGLVNFEYAEKVKIIICKIEQQ